MKIIRKASSAEAVLAWLKAEIKTKRFNDGEAETSISDEILRELEKNGQTTELITDANLDYRDENALRLKILRGYRDWFEDNLDDYSWQLVEMLPEEVGDLEYIDYSYWNELTGGTHKVRDGAETVRNGETIFDVSNDGFLSIKQAMEQGESFEPIIVLQDGNTRRRIVEGHARATGYFLAKPAENQLLVLLGLNRSANGKENYNIC